MNNKTDFTAARAFLVSTLAMAKQQKNYDFLDEARDILEELKAAGNVDDKECKAVEKVIAEIENEIDDENAEHYGNDAKIDDENL